MKSADRHVTAATIPFTQADYRRLPEGFPAELLEGQLVKEPAPTRYHQRLVVRLATRFIEVVGDDRVLVSPVDVWIDEWNVLQPDVLLFDESDAGARAIPDEAVPALVAEILSPSTARRDRDIKAKIYLRAGVREVWLVDPDSRSIEVRSGETRRAVPSTESITTPLAPGLEISLREFFE